MKSKVFYLIAFNKVHLANLMNVINRKCQDLDEFKMTIVAVVLFVLPCFRTGLLNGC